MSYLKGKRVYLSAPIEHEAENANWRDEIKKSLISRFGLEVFDPFADPKQQWAPSLVKAREEKDFETIKRVSKNFVRKDLALVDRADFLIACLPYRVPTTGCVHEIINSNNAKKPTLILCPQGKEKVSFWYWGFVAEECMFGSWDEVFNYLQEVEDGKHKDNDRWAYVYGLI